MEVYELEALIQKRLDALGPAPRAELLHVLMLPDFERADRIGEFWGYPESRAFAELLIDCEEDRRAAGGAGRDAATGRSIVETRLGRGAGPTGGVMLGRMAEAGHRRLTNDELAVIRKVLSASGDDSGIAEALGRRRLTDESASMFDTCWYLRC